MIRLFIDFDGTAAVNDVGDEVFSHFSDFRTHVTSLMQGNINVAEYYRRVVASMQEDVSPEILTEFALKQRADPGLASLIEFCKSKNIDVVILSDGFDAYIDPIMNREGIADVEVFCNTLWHNGNNWQARFPGATESCSCFCASCKRNVVINRGAADDVLIYVGDGASDECASSHCDVIFAKHSLAAWCTQERIPHHPYKTLFDVQKILASKFASGEIRQRRQAVLKRNASVKAE